jgi:hypothetical protein
MTPSERARQASLPTPHGTGAGHNSGCRCDECRAANAARARSGRARHRGLNAARGPQNLHLLSPQPRPPEVRQDAEAAAEPAAEPLDSSTPGPSGATDLGEGVGAGATLAVLALVLIVGIALVIRVRGGDSGDGPPPWQGPSPGPEGFYH